MLSAFIRPNLSLWALLSGVVVVLAVTLTWQPAMDLFRFGPLHIDDLGITLLAGATILVVLQWVKPHWPKVSRTS